MTVPARNWKSSEFFAVCTEFLFMSYLLCQIVPSFLPIKKVMFKQYRKLSPFGQRVVNQMIKSVMGEEQDACDRYLDENCFLFELQYTPTTPVLAVLSSTTTPSASSPFVVLIIFFVYTTSIKFPFSSTLQIPRVTPLLSIVFFSTKQDMQDLLPFTRYLCTTLNPFLQK